MNALHFPLTVKIKISQPYFSLILLHSFYYFTTTSSITTATLLLVFFTTTICYKSGLFQRGIQPRTDVQYYKLYTTTATATKTTVILSSATSTSSLFSFFLFPFLLPFYFIVLTNIPQRADKHFSRSHEHLSAINSK